MRKKFYERVFLFLNNAHHPLLHHHSLRGKWSGYRSINITGDIRVVFKHITENHVELVAIGSHSELYS